MDSPSAPEFNAPFPFNLAIELAYVRSLLHESSRSEPIYCDDPAKYSGAPRYGKGTNRAMFFGNSKYTKQLPGKWRTNNVEKAVLVVCTGDKDYGKTVTGCPYRSGSGSGPTSWVAFRKVAIPVKAYELRTGKLVYDKKVQISGSSCPSTIKYSSPLLEEPVPPPEMYVKPSKTNVRAAFRSLIT
jgi:hypothetical protein